MKVSNSVCTGVISERIKNLIIITKTYIKRKPQYFFLISIHKHSQFCWPPLFTKLTLHRKISYIKIHKVCTILCLQDFSREHELEGLPNQLVETLCISTAENQKGLAPILNHRSLPFWLSTFDVYARRDTHKELSQHSFVTTDGRKVKSRLRAWGMPVI